MDLRNHDVITTANIGTEKVTSLSLLNDKQIIASGETSLKLIDFSGKI